MLDYVNVEMEHANLEGRIWENGQERAYDVLIGQNGHVIGRMYEPGKRGQLADVVSDDSCLRVIEILGAPKHVMEVERHQDSKMSYIRIPALFNWMLTVYGIGVQVCTTDNRIAYA